MDVLNALIIALLASTAVGGAVSLIIQIGKMLLPKAFPDGSADNWRLGLILLTAVGIMIANAFGYVVTIPALEAYAVSFAALGSILMPLVVLLANWFAKTFYTSVFKGVKLIGKTYSPVAPMAVAKK